MGLIEKAPYLFFLAMKKIKIGHVPFESSDNAYVLRNIEILSRLGNVSSVPTIRKIICNPFKCAPKSYDFILASWIENCIINKEGRLSNLGVMKFFIKIILFKILSKKTIFIRHNNYPHAAIRKDACRAARIIDAAENFFDHVVIHSGHNSGSRYKYVPHPLYRLPQFASKEAKFQSGEYFLVFGRILPYKKIESLVNAVPCDVEIIIAGRAPDKRYIEKIQALALGKKIKLIPEFTDDLQSVQLFKNAVGLIISHNDEDMIVSGTFFYALTVGIRVYALETPFFRWAKDVLKVPGLHVFKDIQSLTANLPLADKKHKNFSAVDRQRINNLFGDDLIAKKWTEILGS